MKLTLEVYQESEKSNQWISRCRELDITITYHKRPEVVMIAIAGAVAKTLHYEMKQLILQKGISCDEAFAIIKAKVIASALLGNM